jgi:hypothetical protein
MFKRITRNAGRKSRAISLTIEAVERRRLLSTVIVNTLADETIANSTTN